MGSFAVTCAVTNTTLYRREAVLLPLAPSWRQPYKRRFPGYGGAERRGASLVTGEGASAIFAPLMLPVFGVAGEYGRIETVHEDEHTTWLADRLGQSFDEIQEAIAHGGHLRKIDRLARETYRAEAWSSFQRTADWGGGLYGCWIAREVWDELSAETWTERGEPDSSVYASGGLTPYNLRGMGFVAGEPDPEGARRVIPAGHQPERYTVPYRHASDPAGLPPEKGLVFWSDGGRVSQVTRDGKHYGHLYHPRDVHRALLRGGTGLPEESVRWAERTPALEGRLREAAREALTTLEIRALTREREEKYPSTAFTLVADSTPKELRDARRDLGMARVREKLWHDTDDTDGKADETPVAPVEPFIAEQTFCDGQKHVVLRAHDHGDPTRYRDAAEGSTEHGTLVGVEDCPRRKRGGCGGTPRGVSLKGAGRIAFPEAALEELARQGWRRRWPSPWASSHIQSPYLRVLAPEMPAIYRRALFGRFFPRWLALQTFLGNLHAANRILAPAPHGYQFGHRAIEQRVAKLALRLSRRARKG